MKKLILLAVSAFAALMLAACNDNTEHENTGIEEPAESASAEDEDNDSELEIDETDEEAVESAETDSDNYQLGDSAEIDGITVTISDAFMTDERNDTSIIDVSGVLILEVTYENGTEETFPAGRDITLEAGGEHARSYDLESALPADVGPGESITGQMAYGLENAPENVVAVFEPLMNDSGEHAIFDVEVE
ncbi:MAG: hypothetical protein ACTH14_02510 [Jeotgalicoccus sp.]